MEIWGGNQAIDNAVSVPGIDVWVVSDVYYISQCSAGKVARCMLADVAGHGAGQMIQSLHTMMKKNISTLDQSHCARSLNKAFSQGAGDGEFATALLSTYFAPSKHLVVTKSGHPRPLWFRAATGTWHFL